MRWLRSLPVSALPLAALTAIVFDSAGARKPAPAPRGRVVADGSRSSRRPFRHGPGIQARIGDRGHVSTPVRHRGPFPTVPPGRGIIGPSDGRKVICIRSHDGPAGSPAAPSTPTGPPAGPARPAAPTDGPIRRRRPPATACGRRCRHRGPGSVPGRPDRFRVDRSDHPRARRPGRLRHVGAASPPIAHEILVTTRKAVTGCGGSDGPRPPDGAPDRSSGTGYSGGGEPAHPVGLEHLRTRRARSPGISGSWYPRPDHFHRGRMADQGTGFGFKGISGSRSTTLSISPYSRASSGDMKRSRSVSSWSRSSVCPVCFW